VFYLSGVVDVFKKRPAHVVLRKMFKAFMMVMDEDREEYVCYTVRDGYRLAVEVLNHVLEQEDVRFSEPFFEEIFSLNFSAGCVSVNADSSEEAKLLAFWDYKTQHGMYEQWKVRGHNVGSDGAVRMGVEALDHDLFNPAGLDVTYEFKDFDGSESEGSDSGDE
jgi:hypothetical protein